MRLWGSAPGGSRVARRNGRERRAVRVGEARADAASTNRGVRGGRRERDRGAREASRSTAVRRGASMRTRRRATSGGAFPTFRSASTTPWRSAPAASRTCSAATPWRERRCELPSSSRSGAWRALPRMPFPRAAAGAGVAGGQDRRRRGHRRGPTARAECTRVRSPHAALVGRSRPDAARASRRDRRSRESSMRSAGARPASTRTSCTSRASGRATAGGAACSRFPIRGVERAQPHWRAA